MSKKGIFPRVDDQGEHHEQKKEFAYIRSPEPRSIAHRLDGSCRLYLTVDRKHPQQHRLPQVP